MQHTGAVIKNAFAEDLSNGFLDVFGEGGDGPTFAGIIRYIAGTVFEIFYQLGDAPYHDHEHTFEVCFTGQTILKGMHVFRSVSPREWLNFMVACLGHDIGYVFGIFPGDKALRKKYQKQNENCTGASLTPQHVDRSRQFIKERFGHLDCLDMDLVMEMIEYTRFEADAREQHPEIGSFPGLVRAADLIGQMASPLYIKKMWHLYQEFVETGALANLPFDTVYGMRKYYPDFFKNVIKPLIEDAADLLQLTMEGRTILASLSYNLYHTEKL